MTGMIKGFLGFKFSVPVDICVVLLKWGRFIDKVPMYYGGLILLTLITVMLVLITKLIL